MASYKYWHFNISKKVKLFLDKYLCHEGLHYISKVTRLHEDSVEIWSELLELCQGWWDGINSLIKHVSVEKNY